MPSVWTIGDIHGMSRPLNALLDALPRSNEDVTVFIGDYIDRGEDSAGVVRRVLTEYDRAPDRTVLLWGNHEDMAATHFGFEAPSHFEYDPYDWFANGGTVALQSYGHEPPDLFGAPCPDDLKRLFSLLQPYWQAPRDRFPDLANYVWVHAGLLPGQAPHEATGETLLWVREEFLNSFDPSGRVVIHGHTPMQAVRAFPDKIGVDTGAVFGGVLSALQLPERHVYQADAKGRVTDAPLQNWR